MSYTVRQIFKTAAEKQRKFTVIITESAPARNSQLMASYLTSLGIPCKIIADSAVGYYINQVDLVLVGAEAVVESGGVINQVGTYQISITAKVLSIPFYVATESFKMTRLYPLSQSDVSIQQLVIQK